MSVSKCRHIILFRRICELMLTYSSVFRNVQRGPAVHTTEIFYVMADLLPLYYN